MNKIITQNPAKSVCTAAASAIRELGSVLGLLGKSGEAVSDDVQAILAERAEARAAKNWSKSDELRDKLREMGYIVKDTPQGQQLTQV